MHGYARQLAPDHLPTPFTAAEIRAACPAGRTIRYLIERTGQEPTIRVTRYNSVDADGAVQESWLESADGAIIGPPEQERSTWLERCSRIDLRAALILSG